MGSSRPSNAVAARKRAGTALREPPDPQWPRWAMAVGQVRYNRGQKFECIAIEPHVTRNGKDSELWVLRTNCAQCNRLFTFRLPRRGVLRGDVSRRCDDHKRIGVKAVVPRKWWQDPPPGSVPQRPPRPRRTVTVWKRVHPVPAPVRDPLSDIEEML